MDGLSVAASCVALIQAADKTFSVISQFVQDCKDAQSDLTTVSQELSALSRTLGLLKNLVPDDSKFADSDLMNNTKTDIREIIDNSLNVTKDIEDVLLGQEGRFVAVSWATRGKRKVATFKTLLETNRRALSLAVDTITLATARNIQHDTTNILDDTTHIKGDIGSIMTRISDLEATIDGRGLNDPRTYMLRRYLNDLSSVAGSVCDMPSRTTSPEPEDSHVMHNNPIFSRTNDLTNDGSASTSDNTSSRKAIRVGKRPAKSLNITPVVDKTDWVKVPKTESYSREEHGSDQTLQPDSGPFSRPTGESIADHTGLFIPKPPLKRSYVKIRPRQTLEEDFGHAFEKPLSIQLSPDGTKIIWMPESPRSEMIYNLDSEEFEDLIKLSLTRRCLASISLKNDKLVGLRVLSTDASLLLVDRKHDYWEVYDRLTDKYIVLTTRSAANRNPCILPISEDFSLLVLWCTGKGYCFVRVRRCKSPNGKHIIHSQYKRLPLSKRVGGALGGALSYHDRTFTSIDNKNRTKTISDFGYRRELTPMVCQWKLHPDWFVDNELAVLPEIQDPTETLLTSMTIPDTSSFASADNTLMILTSDLARDGSNYYTMTSWDLAVGSESFRQTLNWNELLGHQTSPAGDWYFSYAGLSKDGKLLMVVRVRRSLEIASGVKETAIIEVNGMRLVHLFEDKPHTTSIFTPDFDVVARISKEPKSAGKTQMFLDVYKLGHFAGQNDHY